jgi:hypothetical protein
MSSIKTAAPQLLVNRLSKSIGLYENASDLTPTSFSPPVSPPPKVKSQFRKRPDSCLKVSRIRTRPY